MTTGPYEAADEAVRRAVRERLDENICVEAGAGTGKTTVLVERMIAVLRSGRARAGDVVAITFTEKAAAELAARVRTGLEAALSGGLADDERTRVEAAIRELGGAHVETIHAFAASMLRERPVEAGIDPGFQVLDDLPSQLAFDAAWDEWLTAELAAEPPPAALVDALNVGLDFKRVREAAELLNRHRDASIDGFGRDGIDLGATVARVSAAADNLRALDPRMKDEDDPAFVAMPDYIELADRLTALLGERGALERAIATATMVNPTRGNQGNWADPDDCRTAKREMGAIRDALDEARGALRRNATADLLAWLSGFVLQYEQARRSAGQADFDDLLLWARKLLRERPEVRDYFAARYRAVLVDEFQDTDPVQTELLVRLCAEGHSDDWRAARPRPGSLFVVGDPKQSIYRFRRADIAMYDELKARVFRTPLEITQNFRSTGAIIDWVNGLFGRLFVERPGLQARYVPLAADERIAGTALAVEVVRGTAAAARAGKPTPAEIRTAEGAALAALVRRRVSAGEWTVRDGSESRAATWRDVAVLVPNRTEIELYEDAFARADVPYRQEGGRTFFKRQEVHELVAILRAIDNPHDAVAIVAALRSSAFGCSDEDLFLYRAAGRRFERTAIDDGGATSVSGGLATLEEFRGLRHTISLPELVRLVLDRTRLVESAMLQPQGEQVAANLLKIIDQARAYALSETGGLRGFVRWLRTNLDRLPDEADATVSEETDDVVRVMTVHAAKGLQFPVVVLANTVRDPRNWTTCAVVPTAHGPRLAVKIGRKEDDFCTPGFAAAELREREHRQQEELRMLYVAATRARDHLVVPFFSEQPIPDEGPGCLNDWLRLVGAERRPDALDASTLARHDGELPVFRRDPAGDGYADAQTTIAGRAAWQAWRRMTTDLAAGPRRVLTATALKPEWEAPSEDDHVRRGGAVDFGSAVHAALERVGLDGGDAAAVANVAAQELGLAPRAAEIERCVRRALASEVMERARRSRWLRRETPFVAPLPAGDGTAEGRIDLLFEEDGGLVVVDFKTDDVSEHEVEARSAHYRAQALVYAWAARRASGLPVYEVVFVYARPGVEHHMPVDDAFEAEAEALVRTGAVAPG